MLRRLLECLRFGCGGITSFSLITIARAVDSHAVYFPIKLADYSGRREERQVGVCTMNAGKTTRPITTRNPARLRKYRSAADFHLLPGDIIFFSSKIFTYRGDKP
jgi:hypothetical protein